MILPRHAASETQHALSSCCPAANAHLVHSSQVYPSNATCSDVGSSPGVTYPCSDAGLFANPTAASSSISQVNSETEAGQICCQVRITQVPHSSVGDNACDALAAFEPPTGSSMCWFEKECRPQSSVPAQAMCHGTDWFVTSYFYSGGAYHDAPYTCSTYVSSGALTVAFMHMYVAPDRCDASWLFIAASNSL